MFKRLSLALCLCLSIPSIAFADSFTVENRVNPSYPNTSVKNYKDNSAIHKNEDLRPLFFTSNDVPNGEVQSFIDNYHRTSKNDYNETRNIALYIYRLGIEYNHIGGPMYNQIEGLANKRTQCMGFTWLSAQLFDKAGIPYRIVETRAISGGNVVEDAPTHIYLEILIGHRWHHFEATYLRPSVLNAWVQNGKLSDKRMNALFPISGALNQSINVPRNRSGLRNSRYSGFRATYTPVIRSGILTSSNYPVVDYYYN